jgi:phenylalanyl-tRNA synthetase alpha chain
MSLSPDALAAALAIPDLTADPAHAVRLVVDEVVAALTRRWPVTVVEHRPHPVVDVADNYDRLGYAPDAVTRDARYSHYVTPATMLRSHVSAGVPPALRELAAAPVPDVLLVLPGMVHRRDAVDRHHVGTPHQLDLWRIVRDRPMRAADLAEMIEVVATAAVPDAQVRAVPAVHPYTVAGRQVDVRNSSGWVELAECGLAAPAVLARAGLDPTRWSGLALGMGLDRAVMLRKGIPDIRLLRGTDPRIAGQMHDLTPWRPVSQQPPARRDLSLVLDAADADAELLGDRARAALGTDADALEELSLRAVTAHEQLPARLGTRPGQVNALVRLLLRPVDRTLTAEEANALRDRVYAALHRGPVQEWAIGAPRGAAGAG